MYVAQRDATSAIININVVSNQLCLRKSISFMLPPLGRLNASPKTIIRKPNDDPILIYKC